MTERRPDETDDRFVGRRSVIRAGAGRGTGAAQPRLVSPLGGAGRPSARPRPQASASRWVHPVVEPAMAGGSSLPEKPPSVGTGSFMTIQHRVTNALRT